MGESNLLQLFSIRLGFGGSLDHTFLPLRLGRYSVENSTLTKVFWRSGPIANFMNHPIWQPLGRLSYSAYIVHLMVVNYFLNIDAKPLHFVSMWQVVSSKDTVWKYQELFQYVYYILPATILTYTFAFFWSCMFELPIVKWVNRHGSGTN